MFIIVPQISPLEAEDLLRLRRQKAEEAARQQVQRWRRNSDSRGQLIGSYLIHIFNIWILYG